MGREVSEAACAVYFFDFVFWSSNWTGETKDAKAILTGEKREDKLHGKKCIFSEQWTLCPRQQCVVSKRLFLLWQKGICGFAQVQCKCWFGQWTHNVHEVQKKIIKEFRGHNRIWSERWKRESRGTCKHHENFARNVSLPVAYFLVVNVFYQNSKEHKECPQMKI